MNQATHYTTSLAGSKQETSSSIEFRIGLGLFIFSLLGILINLLD